MKTRHVNPTDHTYANETNALRGRRGWLKMQKANRNFAKSTVTARLHHGDTPQDKVETMAGQEFWTRNKQLRQAFTLALDTNEHARMWVWKLEENDDAIS